MFTVTQTMYKKGHRLINKGIIFNINAFSKFVGFWYSQFDCSHIKIQVETYAHQIDKAYV